VGNCVNSEQQNFEKTMAKSRSPFGTQAFSKCPKKHKKEESISAYKKTPTREVIVQTDKIKKDFSIF